MNARTGRSLSVGVRRRRAFQVFLTTLTALRLFGVAGFAPSAQAQHGGPPLSVICPPLVSVNWCSNPANQRETCWSYNNNACVQTLRSAFEASYNNLTTGPTPPGESPHGTYSILPPTGMTNGGKLIPGARVSYDQSNLRYVDYDLSYSSIVAIRQRATNFGHFDLQTMTANTSPLHPEWEVDGNAINDTDRIDYATIPPSVHHGQPCAEYVYKKYYDYNRFEDAAASCKSDWICVYNLGVTTTTPGLNHYPLNKKQGTQMTVQLEPRLSRPPPPQPQPKNGFWKIGLSQFYDWFAYRNRYDVANGIGAAIRQVQPYEIVSRWDWHVQMHNQQAHENLTLATYEDMEERQKHITDLYDVFVATTRTLHSVGSDMDIYDIMNPHEILQVGCADIPQLPPQPCRHPIHQLPSYPPASLQLTLRNTVQQIADALIAEWDHKSYADGTTVDHGCLDPSSNRCDWQPKMFAQEYIGRFRPEREQDFQTCLDKTGEVFSTTNFPPMYPADHSDTDYLESWMARANQIIGPLLADVPWTTDASGNGVVGRHKHGGKSLGDPGVFAVDYNYSAGYDAAFTRGGPDGNTICGVNGHAGGSFYADVQIPIIGPQPILDAALQARAGQNPNDPNIYADGHLSVFGVSLYSSGGEVSLSGFNLSPADPNRMHQNIGYDTIIMVSFVPIHLHAGVDFSTGLSWSVSGGAPQQCQSDHGALMSLTGNITPWGNVSADLSAAVGVALLGFGAEAGVRGNLSILQASLPVNLTFSVGERYFPGLPGDGTSGQPNDGNYLSLILNTTSAIELSALSGSISAYAEVCYFLCESVEQEIFRWNGVNLGHVDVFPSLNEGFPLVALKTARPRPSP